MSSSDFSDADLRGFLAGLDRLTWSTLDEMPPEITKHADAFVIPKPRPSPEELRRHIDHAIAVAQGGDAPEAVLHAALRSYYLIAWIDYLLKHGVPREPLPRYAYKVVFTPVFRNGEAPADPE